MNCSVLRSSLKDFTYVYLVDGHDYDDLPVSLKKVFGETKLTSGDSIIDQSVFWAKAILEANAHYLDGEIVPMPCPAEYNFYFTHDVLKTDLAAVNFDTERVTKKRV